MVVGLRRQSVIRRRSSSGSPFPLLFPFLPPCLRRRAGHRSRYEPRVEAASAILPFSFLPPSAAARYDVRRSYRASELRSRRKGAFSFFPLPLSLCAERMRQLEDRN